MTPGYSPEQPVPLRTEQKGRGRAGRSGEMPGPIQRRASNEMCNFLILNISSLQLIPVNMIAYRSQYGSARPAAIIAPAIAATLVSTVVAVIYCKIKDAFSKREAKDGLGRDQEKGSRGFRGRKAV